MKTLISCTIISTKAGEFDDIMCQEGHQTITVQRPRKYDNEPHQLTIKTIEISKEMAATIESGDNIMIEEGKVSWNNAPIAD